MKWCRAWARAFALCVCVAVLPYQALARASDPEVLRAQETLRARGYDPGPVDGVLGAKTRKALRQLQHGMRLPETGVLDAGTRAALQDSGAGVAERVSEPPTATAPPPKASEPESPPVTSVVSLVYKPPQRGTPGGRVAAAVRGEGKKAPLLYALVPDDHIGQTVQEQPVLYWYLSEPTNDRVELTIVDEQAVSPLFEGALPPPSQVGIQQIRLADYGVRLPLDTPYKWFVSIVPDPDHPSHNIVAGGGIRRVEPSQPLHTALARAGKRDLPALYADAGLWYDTLLALAELIEATPSDPGFRAQRASLLEQVGLHDVAAHER